MKKTLTIKEKNFCKLIIDMLRVNPYSKDRDEIENKIAEWDWGKFGVGWAVEYQSAPQYFEKYILNFQNFKGLSRFEEIWADSRPIDRALFKIFQYKDFLETKHNSLKFIEYSSEDERFDNNNLLKLQSSYDSIKILLICYVFHLSAWPFYKLIENYENFNKSVEKKVHYEIESMILGRTPYSKNYDNTKYRPELFQQHESTLKLVLLQTNEENKNLQTLRDEDPEQIALKPLIKDIKKEIADLYNFISLLLKKSGFEEEESAKFFSIFFQLCRAYHFIRKGIKGNHKAIELLKQKIWDSIITKDLLIYKDFLCDKMADFSILILGDTGTGKSAIADVIGQSGYIKFDKKEKIFLENFKWHYKNFNLSSLSDNLIEAELFGHAEGAFSGAIYNKKGLFELSGNYGTLFLDEIGELSERNQVLLLKILQERKFFRVGEPQLVRHYKGRTICATNRNINHMRKKGDFRDDLYFRISTNIIEAPRLRDIICKQDGYIDYSENGNLFILVTNIIANNFGLKFSFDEKPPENLAISHNRSIVLSQIAKLPKDYPWDGNFRELQQCIKQILLTGAYKGDPTQLNKRDPDFIKMPTNEDELNKFQKQLFKYHYGRLGTYKAVGVLFGQDERTIKKKILSHAEPIKE